MSLEIGDVVRFTGKGTISPLWDLVVMRIDERSAVVRYRIPLHMPPIFEGAIVHIRDLEKVERVRSGENTVPKPQSLGGSDV